MAGGDPDSVLDELLHLPVDLQCGQIGPHGFPFPDHRRQPEACNERETVQILASADERPRVTVQDVEHLERRLAEQPGRILVPTRGAERDEHRRYRRELRMEFALTRTDPLEDKVRYVSGCLHQWRS